MTSNRMAELDSVDTGKLGDLARKQIADDIETGVEEKRSIRPLLPENNRLQNDTGSSLEFFERQDITGGARPVAEGENIPESDPDWASVITLDTYKYGISDSITEEAIQDGREDVVAAVETEISEALANQEDAVAVAGLAGGVRKVEKDVPVSGGSAALAEDQIIHVDEVLDSNDSSLISTYDVDRENGKITSLSGPSNVDVTYWSIDTSRVNIQDSDSNGDIDPQVDLLQGLKNTLSARKYEPDVLVMNDTSLGYIIDSKLFIDSSKYGGEVEMISNAEVGRLFGMKIVVDSQIPDKYVIAADTDVEPAKFLVKQPVEVETDDLYGSDKQAIYATQRYGAGLVNGKAVEILDVDNNL